MTEVDKIIALIEKSISHSLSDNDVAELRRALLVSGQGNVLQIGKYNIHIGQGQDLHIGKYNIHIGQGQDLHIGDRIYQGPDLEMLRQVVREVQAQITSDHYTASLQEYFRALRRYCAELPYLTLTDIRPPKNLDEVYVPLRARQWQEEALPRRPAAPGESLTVEQVLRQARTPHLLILGQPGAGKSTLLRQLAERAYDDPQSIGLERPHLPLLLPLRVLAHAEGALEERLNQALQNELRLTRALPDGFLDAWPQPLDAPWLFLLDGLDEVPADRYLSLKQWLGDLLASPNIARVILTSRPSAYTEKEWDTNRLSVYKIQPFTPDQTAELARRWFGEETPAFLQALEAVRSGVLTETPLLITIAAKVYLEKGRLPERCAYLYQEFVDIWLDEARERGLRDELDADVLDLAQPTLAHLALAMTDHPEWTDEKSLKPVVAEYLNDQLNLKARAPAVAERFLRVMARRSGVFLKREKRYEWVHPTFREYFAALALNQQLESGKSFDEVLGERALREKWVETIVTLAEMCAKPKEIVIWLSEQAVVKKSGYIAFLAYVSWWSSDARNSKEAKTTVVNALVSGLGDPKTRIRQLSISALGEIGDARAVEPLIAALRDQEAEVRWHAAEALGKIGDACAVEPLITALREVEVDLHTAIFSSNEAHQDITYNVLAQQLYLQKFVITELSRFITRIVDEDALAKLGASAVESLISTLQDNDKAMRVSAIKVLGRIGDIRAVEPLVVALDDPDSDVVKEAAWALGQIGDIRALEPLISALHHPDAEVRQNVARALGELGNVGALDALVKALSDPNESVRWEATLAIGKIGDNRVVNTLISALQSSSSLRRSDAAYALGKIGDPCAVETLITALRDPDENVRKGVAYALGKIGDARAVEPLIAALRDRDPKVREYVVLALAKINDIRTVEPLITMLHDTEASVRILAIVALAQIGDLRALPELERLAQEDKDKVLGYSVADAAREAIARIRARMAQTDQQGDER